MPNTILLNVRNQFEKEAPLASASTPITPGMLLEFASDGDVQPHTSAAGVPTPLVVATEMPIRSGSGIDDAYDTLGEAVPHHFAISGDELYLLLAAGENVANQDELESDGAGALQAATTGAIVKALEAVDNSAAYVSARIRVEVL